MNANNGQPSNALRNVTEVFIYLRNNKHQNRGFFNDGFEPSRDENMTLISLDSDRVVASTTTPPSWVNVIDEISYEIERIQSRIGLLKDLQQKHLKRPDFSEEAAYKEQDKIKQFTDEVTAIFTHIRQLIRLLQESDINKRSKLNLLRENVTSSFLITLNQLLNDFRISQSSYVRQIDARKKNVDSFLLASDHDAGALQLFDDLDNSGPSQELTIDQLQAVVENESMVREREKEVVKISKSILELNTLFKDLASLVLDQGTILDRIDYNIEQSVIRIRSAYKSVQKAEQYQRNRKIHFIVILAGIALFLLLLLIATKL